MPRSAQSGHGAEAAAALYERSGAAAYGLSAEQFAAVLDEILRKYLPNSAHASAEQKTEFCAGLRLEELALARACAAGNERAWQDFISRYRQKLHGMALHIRSEEHTSELQSLRHLVCRLLLEKKNEADHKELVSAVITHVWSLLHAISTL